MNTTPETIVELVERFGKNLSSYREGGYNEAELRQEYLDPFFEALGWDVRNQLGAEEALKPVVREGRLRIGSRSKIPDYSFRYQGVRKWFLEAKKPSVDITHDGESSFQLRRYGWSAKLPVSILSNFEYLILYDCRLRPEKKQSAAVARKWVIRFDEYVGRWSELVSLLSYQRVAAGEFDEWAENKLSSNEAVDDAFLNDLDYWRIRFGDEMLQKNRFISNAELNVNVQKIVDQLVFLRVAEARGLEIEGKLLDATEANRPLNRLVDLVKRAVRRYSKEIFSEESFYLPREKTEKSSENFCIGEKTVKDMIFSLYPPTSPYAFGVLSAEILGSIYERFLGKVLSVENGKICLTLSANAQKAGGIYYTPSFVTKDIVRETIGKKLRNLSLSDMKKLVTKGKFSVLDPACGSGSFLLEAYQCFLDWYLSRYADQVLINKSKKEREFVTVGQDGVAVLTLKAKKRILLDHIFGIDIDERAIEATKLALLLKITENQTRGSLSDQYEIFHEEVCPVLKDNICCGNSLVDVDAFQLDQTEEGNLLEVIDAKPFRWLVGDSQSERRRFEVVIGNPPYGALLSSFEKSYVQKKFRYQSYQLDTYLLFVEKILEDLLAAKGTCGIIIPNPWLTNTRQSSLRKFVMETVKIQEVVHFRFPVFKAAKVTVDTQIVYFQLEDPVNHQPVVSVIEKLAPEGFLNRMKAKRLIHQQNFWVSQKFSVINIFLTAPERNLLARVASFPLSVSDVATIVVGMKPYQTGKGKPKQTKEMVQARCFDAQVAIDESFVSYLRGADVHKYVVDPVEERFISYGPWLAEPRESARFSEPEKILVRQTGDSLIAAMDRDKRVCMNNLHVITSVDDSTLTWLLPILNSKFMNWAYQSKNPEIGEALAEVKKINIETLKLPLISEVEKKKLSAFCLQAEKAAMNERRATSDSERSKYFQVLNLIEKKIDFYLSSIFSLTEEEVKIVEKAARGRKG